MGKLSSPSCPSCLQELTCSSAIPPEASLTPDEDHPIHRRLPHLPDQTRCSGPDPPVVFETSSDVRPCRDPADSLGPTSNPQTTEYGCGCGLNKSKECGFPGIKEIQISIPSIYLKDSL